MQAPSRQFPRCLAVRKNVMGGQVTPKPAARNASCRETQRFRAILAAAENVIFRTGGVCAFSVACIVVLRAREPFIHLLLGVCARAVEMIPSSRLARGFPIIKRLCFENLEVGQQQPFNWLHRCFWARPRLIRVDWFQRTRAALPKPASALLKPCLHATLPGSSPLSPLRHPEV
jgi:hypothetical protein